MRHIQLGAGCLALALFSTGCISNGVRDQEAIDRSRKASSHLEIGVDHLSNGKGARALREFMAAERLDPENPRVHYALGDAYLARGRRDQAEAHLRRALEISPEHHDARLSLSALLLVTKRYEEAIVECDVLIDDPTFSAPWRAQTNRGWALYKLERVDAAREALDLARELRADYWPATLAMARLENQNGRRLHAVRLLNDVMAFEPGPEIESEVNYLLAEIYVALGNRRSALGHLTASVARSPEGPWAKRSQEYLKLLHAQ